MIRRAVVLLAVCALLACGKAAPPPAPETTSAPPESFRAPEPDVDSDNLLNLAYGSAVVSRTGELNLERSAVHAIDGFPESVWISSPGVPQETIVYSLLAPARIHSVGVSVVKDTEAPGGMLFESSVDGKQWSELARVPLRKVDERQMLRVKETEARFLRVRALDHDKYYVRVRGFHALGAEIAPPDTPPFGGCWTINGWAARIEQNGARITGVIEADPPIVLDGGTDNRAGMVMWMQGPMWGYAAITRTPDGTRLTGLRFFEEVDSKHVGDAWFGERCEANTIRTPLAPPAAFLRKAKRYSVFGLVFDPDARLVESLSGDALQTIVDLQPQRIIVREFQGANADANRRIAAARIVSLRAALRARGVDVSKVDFIAAGSGSIGPPIAAALQRLLASRVDIIARL